MKNMLNDMKVFMGRDWSFAEKVLVIACCILFGMVYGFILSPVKRGISCGNNNCNTYNEADEEFWIDEE